MESLSLKMVLVVGVAGMTIVLTIYQRRTVASQSESDAQPSSSG